MTDRMCTVAFQGIEAMPVDVQAQFLSGNSIQRRGPPRQGGGGKPRKSAGGTLCGRAGATGASGSPSISRPPTSPRKAAITICRSRLACSPPWGSCRRISCSAMWCSANWRSMARSPRSPARCRPPSPPMAGDLGLICPKACGPEAAWAARMSISWHPSTIIQISIM